MEEEGWSGCCTGRACSRVWMRSQPVAGAEVPEVLAAMLEVLAAVPAMSKRAPSEVGSADMCCVRSAAGRGSTKIEFAGSSSESTMLRRRWRAAAEDGVAVSGARGVGWRGAPGMYVFA